MLLKCLDLCFSKDTSASEGQYPTVIEELCHQFSLADIRESTNNFDENKIIGHGIFFKVFKGCLKHNKTAVTLKRMDENSHQGNEEFKKEIELLCQLRHPNLVSPIGYCNHKGENIIVYEYMPNGSLYDHLHNRYKKPLSWKKRLEICIEVARGVHYLHTGAKHIRIHRDIKPQNILLDSKMVPKLSDFGLSLQPKRKLIKVQDISGTYKFLAPERLENGDFSDKSDVYSFGAVLLDVVSRESFLPTEELEKPICSYGMQGLPFEQIIDPALEGKIAPECWEVFIDIIHKCLKYEPNERPSMGEVELELEHALTLQQEADARKTSCLYSFLSTNVTQPS